MSKQKIVGWFSCGNNSAVMSSLLVKAYGKSKDYELRIVRCYVKEEHHDNDRFHADVQKWIDYPIETIRSSDFKSANSVWVANQYMSGPKGAPCTAEMKKGPRWALEREWGPDFQAFGFSLDEKKRADRFQKFNPEIRLIRILEEQRITKKMCAVIIAHAGIELPVMYRMGFANNNCIGCVKASSPGYWAKVRHFFPKVFTQRAKLSRKFGAKLLELKGERVFLDELPKSFDWSQYERSHGFECGIACGPVKRIK